MLAHNYIVGDSGVKIAASIEAAISDGRVHVGDLLPPVRSVAALLRVSPATVASAYRMLRDRGVVIADGRRGTRVREAPPILAPVAPTPEGARDLATGNPDEALLPRLKSVRFEHRLYGDTLNDPRLLKAAREQFEADGVPSDSVAILSGALDGIERVLREYLRPGDRVIVEDPCFTGITDLLASLGLTPVAVEIDEEGLRFDQLRRALARPAAAMIVTPRAQNPTGSVISTKRARQIRSLLSQHPEVLLIEDDHAGVIAGAPYNTLVTRTQQRWAVVRSVSKSLGPDLRVAFVAADPMTVARLEGRQTLGIRWVSHILQRTVATLLTDRMVLRQLLRAAERYTERRNALIDALGRHGIEAFGASGLNVWIPVHDEPSVIRGLLDRGWAVNAGQRYRINTPPAIRVTIAALSPVDARKFADDLAGLVTRAARTSVA